MRLNLNIYLCLKTQIVTADFYLSHHHLAAAPQQQILLEILRFMELKNRAGNANLAESEMAQ
ncbi:hypothetical protein [Arcanobacterium hippocoleae]|uniref:Uncharacterized protein n=1 Tax=Arcanobacterium hippocoleae TaxID=149017 RepID=A0ABU1T488_9ACTO|nr:hypothetical protein [Arcanobacterium hippocoleae]MDR6940076.1 hypothetical protein [Arcanobacterium hippocoleae]